MNNVTAQSNTSSIKRWLKVSLAFFALAILILFNVLTLNLAHTRLSDFNRELSRHSRPFTETGLTSDANSMPQPPENSAQQPSSMPQAPDAREPENQPNDFNNSSSPNNTTMPDDGQKFFMTMTQDNSSHIPYLVGIFLQTLCLAIVIVYLIMSRLCHKTLRQTFKNSDKTIIFVLGSLLLALVAFLVEAIALQLL